ncbi:MAG: 4-(cytidine 5'-diphospho)-2-C-methyl-D-erythritol kinase [Chloroherpetonaceae bacterium]|nr:4-(cytidine 5'-diphospho)-2-C-methyl-D-erythritol kinase [Chthonomonadaceae bacterium]MDW8208257.1 4-(cytidine 5'-diphospho)-2-C-methyl-D-erythritol kinase [Chloroherpetonaceae bacterium]
MRSITLRSCAKINLTLDVFSKRADGYHSIASVLQAISLHDTLQLIREAEPGVRFQCESVSGDPIPLDDTNLAVRAVRAAMEAGHAHPATGVSIRLIKRIPVQAGLGGGSSNAAAALIGVNALLELGLEPVQLHELAACLGADVPFFLYGGTVVARGRGEELTPLPDIPPLHLVVVKPEESVSTGWAYEQLDRVPDRVSHRGTRRMEEALRSGDRDRLIAFQCNDFELVVFRHFPRLAWLSDELMMAGALTVRLCGSGSALYGVAPDASSAERIAELLRKRHPRVYVARTLTRQESLPRVETDSSE